VQRELSVYDVGIYMCMMLLTFLFQKFVAGMRAMMACSGQTAADDDMEVGGHLYKCILTTTTFL
jgi:hypothetical protein